MKDLNINKKYMTVKELAYIMKVSTDLIKKRIKEMFPNKMENGKTTYLNEVEVTALKLRIQGTLNCISEFRFGKAIVYNLFSEYKIYSQYSVCNNKYKIDWYIPELNIAIEFDEINHKSNKKNDLKRQKEIEKKLGCKFIRYKHGF